jgi:RNA-directed DNA polymerase
MGRRTHPNKSDGWLKQKYFSSGGRFGFFARKLDRTGESKVLRLHSLSRTLIERHIKVRGEANPYDPVYTEYFERRRWWRTLPCKRTGTPVHAGV